MDSPSRTESLTPGTFNKLRSVRAARPRALQFFAQAPLCRVEVLLSAVCAFSASTQAV